MKGLIFDIKRFAVHDGPGIRTTIFFKGCPLQCWWCHNPESCFGKIENIIKSQTLDGFEFEQQEQLGRYYTVGELMKQIDKEAVFYDESGGGVTLSGGEPLMQPDFAIELLKTCQSKGYHTTLDTSGYVKQETLEKAAVFTDLFLFDLKHHDTAKHKHYTGVVNKKILENLRFLINQKKQVRLRIPIVPGVNDSEPDIEAFVEQLKELEFTGQVDLLPFHNMADSKYEGLNQKNRMNGKKSIKKTDLHPLKALFEKEGFKVKIGG